MQVMQFVLALADGGEQARRFQYFEVLRNRLSREAELMFHRQARA